jgi:phosphate transport system substrate-binding protein
MSKEGQAIAASKGYIASDDNAASYTASGLTGKITLAGSTSVSPLMDKIADAYKAINSGVEIEIQQTGSSAGMTSAMEGACDIGMASRELKDSEKAVLTGKVIAQDGIAVIVNKDSKVNNLTSEQIKKIYLGEIKDWSEITD